MHYVSTRDAKRQVSSAEAIVAGLSPDGGLFVPECFPRFSIEDLAGMLKLDYSACASKVLGTYLSDFTHQELDEITKAAYGDNFDNTDIAPVRALGGESVMELFHGPTLAFKDMALQILPHLMSASIQKTGETRKVLILVATSGDTGKAALEGYKNVPGTAIIVFYPREGVSSAQKLQMITQEGSNVAVYSVEGNFDDAQNGVKRIFCDDGLAQTIDTLGYKLSSANSINWGRLVPQIAYYFWAYLTEVRAGRLTLGDRLNVVVPTGNFGNILAAYYAKRMGLPLAKLICASNSNNVLTDFFNTGAYDSRRSFFKTSSPSMDILISSNLERLLFEAAGRDEETVKRWMKALSTQGRYEVGEEIRAALIGDFYAGCSTEEEAKATIQRVFESSSYLMDPHTAVAQAVYEQYKAETGDSTASLVVSTASPYKFASDVLLAIAPSVEEGDEFAIAKKLSEASKTPVPFAIAALEGKPRLHTESCATEDMGDVVLSKLRAWCE